MCDYCFEWHFHATEVLSGAVPRGCQSCGLSFDTLKDRTLGDEVKMYVVLKDGIYQILCPGCTHAYVRKRSDLFGGTEFGYHTLKIN